MLKVSRGVGGSLAYSVRDTAKLRVTTSRQITLGCTAVHATAPFVAASIYISLGRSGTIFIDHQMDPKTQASNTNPTGLPTVLIERRHAGDVSRNVQHLLPQLPPLLEPLVRRIRAKNQEQSQGGSQQRVRLNEEGYTQQ